MARIFNTRRRAIWAAALLTTLLLAGTAAASVSFVLTWGSEGTGDGQFDLPIGVAVNSSGQVYVTDDLNYRIQKFGQGYNFSGFFQPVDNLPTVNVAKAGAAIPVRFSLNGNQGLGIFAAGSPGSKQTACSSSTPLSDVEETVAAGSSSLSYDAGSDQYNYVWKTDGAWAGTCRQFILQLNDGSFHYAKFKFR